MRLASEGTWVLEAFPVFQVLRARQAPRASQENRALKDRRDQLALQERWDPRGRRVQWENRAFLEKLG